jgi:hypothetical protein
MSQSPAGPGTNNRRHRGNRTLSAAFIATARTKFSLTKRRKNGYSGFWNHAQTLIFLAGSGSMPKSILEAIKLGFWDFEPGAVEFSEFDASDAMPGTAEKLRVIEERVRRGLPLWHADDRADMEATSPARRKPR